MEYVIAVNRTSKPLVVTWDGRKRTLKPGDNPLPKVVALAAKRQNPIMGTMGGDPWDVQHLIGIREMDDPIDPVEQSDSIELVDPAILHAGKDMRVVQGMAANYRRVSQVQDGALPTLTGFESNPSGKAPADFMP